MLKDAHAFSGFSVKDLTEAKEFYQDKLGLNIEENPMGLKLKLTGDNLIFIYHKEDHQPATFTILNFSVKNIDEAIDELQSKGINLEKYPDMQQDDKGVARGLSNNMGPDIAWFKDPSGNILSVLQDG